MDPQQRTDRLLTAAEAYHQAVSQAYDEVIDQIAARVAKSGALEKLDLAALTAWKRLRADTPWMGQLMSLRDAEVRTHTATAVSAARNVALTTPEAGRAARSALSPLPGFKRGDALASAACFAAAPQRLAIYDIRAHRGLTLLGLALDNRPGRYGRYLELVEQCRQQLRESGITWSARQVDLALYQLGGQRSSDLSPQ